MRFLFDTQLWIAYVGDPDRFPRAALAILTDAGAELVWSSVTIWETAIKYSLGRADFTVSPRDLLDVLRAGPFTALPVRAEHTLPLAGLPPLHEDPFDRLLIAQATVENLMLVTTDHKIAAYPGPIRCV